MTNEINDWTDRNISTVSDFEEVFPDNDTAIKFFEYMRWGGTKAICPSCGNEKSYWLSTVKKYKCAKCQLRYTATSHSMLHSSKISCAKWLLGVWVYLRSGDRILTTQLSPILEITDPVAHVVRARLASVFKRINKSDKTKWEVFKEAVKNMFDTTEQLPIYSDIRKKCIAFDDKIILSDIDTYNKLTLYTKIIMRKASWHNGSRLLPEEIVSETFLNLPISADGYYETKFVLKILGRTLAKMSYAEIKGNGNAYSIYLMRLREWKADGRENLRSWYLSALEARNFKEKGIAISQKEIREDEVWLSEIKDRVKKHRMKFYPIEHNPQEIFIKRIG